MARRVNLADPDFEPTDDELRQLSARAFAGVAAAHERALARLRDEIAAARAEALRAFQERSRRATEKA